MTVLRVVQHRALRREEDSFVVFVSETKEHTERVAPHPALCPDEMLLLTRIELSGGGEAIRIRLREDKRDKH